MLVGRETGGRTDPPVSRPDGIGDRRCTVRTVRRIHRLGLVSSNPSGVVPTLPAVFDRARHSGASHEDPPPARRTDASGGSARAAVGARRRSTRRRPVRRASTHRHRSTGPGLPGGQAGSSVASPHPPFERLDHLRADPSGRRFERRSRRVGVGHRRTYRGYIDETTGTHARSGTVPRVDGSYGRAQFRSASWGRDPPRRSRNADLSKTTEVGYARPYQHDPPVSISSPARGRRHVREPDGR